MLLISLCIREQNIDVFDAVRNSDSLDSVLKGTSFVASATIPSTSA